MWLLNKKRLLDSSVLREAVDCHSHILPCVDDGMKSTSKALEALAYYERLGISKVFLTPHINENFQNTYSQLLTTFEELQTCYQGPVQLALSAEYKMDAFFDKQLESGQLLPLGKNSLLVETFFTALPINFHETIYEVQKKGYNLVLAHPERYSYLDKKQCTDLKNMGCEFQLNLLSFCGIYGDCAKKNAFQYLRNNYYDFVGSDIHNLSTFSQSLSRLKLSSSDLKSIVTLFDKNKTL